MMISSLLLFVAYLAYYVLTVYPQKTEGQAGNAMTITGVLSMCLSMMSSVLIGTIIGVGIQNLAFATMIAFIVSIPLAVIIGKPFGAIVTMEAASSGIMGSMMGVMLGDMLEPDSANLMLLFWDCVYIINAATMILLIKKKEFVQSSKFFKNPFYSFALSILFPMLIIGTVHFIVDYPKENGTANRPSSHGAHQMNNMGNMNMAKDNK